MHACILLGTRPVLGFDPKPGLHMQAYWTHTYNCQHLGIVSTLARQARHIAKPRLG